MPCTYMNNRCPNLDSEQFIFNTQFSYSGLSLQQTFVAPDKLAPDN